MKWRPTFTIWTVNYNLPELTVQFLRSIRTRHLCDVGVLVTGDRGLAAHKSEILELSDYCVNHSNESLAKTWNYAIEQSLSDWVMIFNNDVLLAEFTIDQLWAARRLAKVVSCVDVSPEINIPRETYPYLRILNDWPEFDGWNYKGLQAEADFSGFLISKKVWQELGGFDEAYLTAYFEDMDFKQRMWEKGYNYCGVRAAPFYHLGQASTQQQGHMAPYFKANRERYMQKWGHVRSRLELGGINVTRR